MWRNEVKARPFLCVAFAAICAMGLGGCANQPGMYDGRHEAPNSASPTASIHLSRAMSGDFNRALTRASEGKFAEAATIFGSVLDLARRVGDTEHQAQALFWLGFCSEKTGQPLPAAAYYRQVVADYPQSKAAGHARTRLETIQRRQAPPVGPERTEDTP